MEKYNVIETGDGTLSLYSNEYRESMHSDSGAYDEALLKHVIPSRVLQSGDEQVSVLDVGFGLGYNILALIHEASRVCPGKRINIVSLEKDTSHACLLESIVFNDERDRYYSLVKEGFVKGFLNYKNISMIILFGDARETLMKIKDTMFHAVFHDPYSPSKNPELWTLDFFREIYGMLRENAIVTTYSSAPHIRMAMIEAGFCVGTGPSVGRKREGTIASRGSAILSLTEHEILLLKENIKSTPYRDSSLRDSRENILEARIQEMKERRLKACRQAPQG